jgi:hypothetical protein
VRERVHLSMRGQGILYRKTIQQTASLCGALDVMADQTLSLTP